MSRRILVSALGLLAQAPMVLSNPTFGDAEWQRRFDLFLRELNQFIVALNDDRLDLDRWKRVQNAWAGLGTEKRR